MNLVICYYFFILLINSDITQTVSIDNGVEGDPTIVCGSNEVSITISTKKPFDGKIFVKGEYGNPECTSNGTHVSTTATTSSIKNTPITTRTTGSSSPTSAFKSASPTPASQFSSTKSDQCPPCPVCASGANDEHARTSRQGSASPNSAKLVIKIGTCNMKRERSLNPSGVTLSLTVVVSFHQMFITKVDKAYQLRCFYMESEKTVTSIVDVSMPQTTELVAQAPMPVCSYSIRRSSPDGPEIQYAKVGDTVYHRWQCTSTSPAFFGMLVHSCTVDDGSGQKVQVINRTGCSMDKYVISDLHYENSLYAFVEAHVFKFADRSVLDFQCAINICIQETDGCLGVTPPICGRTRSKRESNVNNSNDTLAIDPSEYRNDWDLHAQRVTVVDLDDNIRSEDLERFERSFEARSHQHPRFASLSHQSKIDDQSDQEFKSTYCLSVAAFGVLVSACTFVLTVSTAILTALYFVRHKHE